jgi:uncharacterized membrane protein YfcA
MGDLGGWVLAGGGVICLVVAVISVARRQAAIIVATAVTGGFTLVAFATRALLFPASDWWIAAAVGVGAAALVIIGVRRVLREPSWSVGPDQRRNP